MLKKPTRAETDWPNSAQEGDLEGAAHPGPWAGSVEKLGCSEGARWVWVIWRWAWLKKWPRALAAVNGSRGLIWTWRWSCPRVLARRSRGMAHRLDAEEAADGGARGDRFRLDPTGLGRGRR